MRFKGIAIAAACLVLTSTAVYGDEWSWGSDKTPSSGSARSLDATPVIPLSHSSSDFKTQPPQEGDTSPRFLGLAEKLCNIGIGFNCKKPHVVRPNIIPVSSYTNVPQHRPFVAPVKNPSINLNSHMIPPQPLPVHPSPVHGSGSNVVHHHSHTHIHHGAGNNDIPLHGPGISNTANFQPSHPSTGHHVQPPVYRPEFPAYREECTCVHASYCNSYDVVARSAQLDISDLLDARTRTSDIKSNATAAEEEEPAVTPEDETESETSSSRRAKVLSLVDSEKETRVRRDTLTVTDGSLLNSTNDVQGRRLSYVPGVTGCGAAYVCCRNPQLHQPQQHYTCGRRHSTGIVARVKNPHYVNGDTEFGEYPWHVAILNTVNDEYVCGGALIDDRHIVTAAHCVNKINPLNLKIRLGDWDVSGSHEFYSHVEIPVTFLVIHPQYYAGNLQNDIAVIRMQSYVDFASNPHISPVCLPEKSYNYFVGQRCHSSGWGKDAFGSQGQYQTILKEVELPIVEHHQCEAALRHTRLGYQFSLHEGMLCAGGEEGKDTCQGDGGGPLVCAGANGRIQLTGLVSWGIGCGQHGLPGIYVNIAHYVSWIHTITRAP